MKYNYESTRYSPYPVVPQLYHPTSDTRRHPSNGVPTSNQAVQVGSRALDRLTRLETRVTQLESSETSEQPSSNLKTIEALTKENNQLKLEIKELLCSLMQEIQKLNSIADTNNELNLFDLPSIEP
ncbi:hypothetical protein EYZ11_012762 [Aspergillus tanneri]|uniref:Uncharacterized protein n=1 Tax=Aspergillus tanneri TaxID=1220188 RepID=A0A4S3J4S7_9EURO|nr:hypothetical protein EYZ11_012762 [Aspergillus tanneri]